jgi:hypothetical protein
MDFACYFFDVRVLRMCQIAAFEGCSYKAHQCIPSLLTRSLTSAVQSQGTIIVDVRRRSKIPAKSRIQLWNHSHVSAHVRVGWCTTGVHETHCNGSQ